MTKAKPYEISKQLVWDAYKKVKANRGAAGVDGQSLAAFEKDLKNNLYKIWNRMSSGSYFPPPVRLVEIPKGNTGSDTPTRYSDRFGPDCADGREAGASNRLSSRYFHPDSYGYRPGKSALDAVGVTRQRCWRQDWVIDLDIKGFFDNLDWNLRPSRGSTSHGRPVGSTVCGTLVESSGSTQRGREPRRTNEGFAPGICDQPLVGESVHALRVR